MRVKLPSNMRMKLPSMASVCRMLTQKKSSKVAPSMTPFTPAISPKEQPMRGKEQLQKLGQALHALSAGAPQAPLDIAEAAEPVAENSIGKDPLRKSMMSALTTLEAIIVLSRQAIDEVSTTGSMKNLSVQGILLRLELQKSNLELISLLKELYSDVEKVNKELKDPKMSLTERKNLSTSVDRLTEKRLEEATDLADKIETLSKAIQAMQAYDLLQNQA